MERATQVFAPSERLLEIAEEFVDRVRNRESPTVEEYIDRFPETAEEIRRYLPMLVPSSSAQSVSSSWDCELPIHEDLLPVGVSRYHVQSMIGSGSMGAVYQARDLELDRLVGLKIPQLDHRQSVERFYREARAMATVDHRNVCSVFDVGQFEPEDIDAVELRSLVGRPFLTMGFIEGNELSQFMEQPWDQVDAAKLVAKIANALQVVHDAGVVHRDIKPGNIIMDLQGEPVITDFGLARRDLPEEVELTVDGQIVGSPAYMSPEQINGSPELGPPSDIYSLGVVLYEMLCGRRPFTGSPLTLLRDICWKDAPPPKQIRDELDSDLESICLRAIEKDIDKRYQHAAELASDLNAYLDGHYVPPATSKRNRKRSTLLWFTVPVACLLLGLTIAKPKWLEFGPKLGEEDSNGFVIPKEPRPKLSREAFRAQLDDAFYDHFKLKSYAAHAPNISANYARVFSSFGITPDSTSANALKVFIDEQPDDVRTDILVGLESWLLCMLRGPNEDVPVPWLRTQLEANHDHHTPLRTALIEMDKEKIKVLTKQFALRHFDPRISVLTCLFMRSQEPESAMWLAQEANKTFPNNAAILGTMGLLHSGQQQKLAACEAFQKAAELKLLPQFLARLSLCRSARKEFDEAIASAEQALELAPEYETAHFALGKAFFLADQREEAYRQLPLAIDRDCCFLPQAHGLMARASVRLGEPTVAMKHARQALTLYRESESWFSLTRLAQDMLDEFETVDEHMFQQERQELVGKFLRGAKRPSHYRRLRPYLVRLRNDVAGGDGPDRETRLEQIRKWIVQVDRLKRGKR